MEKIYNILLHSTQAFRLLLAGTTPPVTYRYRYRYIYIENLLFFYVFSILEIIEGERNKVSPLNSSIQGIQGSKDVYKLYCVLM